MKLLRVLRRVTLWLVSLAFVLVIISAAVLVLEITVDLDAMKPAAETAASRAVGVPVRIGGDIKLTPGLFSSIEVTDVSLGEESSASELGMARVGRARLSVAAIPLIEGRIQVKEVLAENVAVRFGDELLDNERARTPSESPTASTAAEPDERGLVFEEVAELILRDVVLDAAHPSPIVERLVIQVTELEGSAARGQALRLRGTGSIQDQPLAFVVAGGSLDDFFQLRMRWPVNLEATLGKTTLALSRADSALPAGAPAPAQALPGPKPSPGVALDYRLSLEGERLNDLDRLIGVSLPPLGPYAVGGRFQVAEEQIGVYGLEVEVRQSSLKGDLIWVDTVEPQRFDVTLETGELQLDDFDVGDWSPLQGREAPSQTAAPAGEAGAGYQVPKALLDPAVMRLFEVDLSLEVKAVSSGPDLWGAGRLGVQVKDGRLLIDPLRVELPGGAVDLTAVFEPVEHEALAAAHLWPTKVSGQAGGMHLRLSRVLQEQAGSQGDRGDTKLLEYEVKASGERLDGFNDLAEVSLPPWGPYSVEGRLLAFEERFDVAGLELRVGESDLSGDVSLQLGSDRPRLDIDLATETLQMDDFEVGDWSPLSDTQPSDATPAETAAGPGGEAASDAIDVDALLSRQTLARADGRFSLRVGRVLSGRDALGGGELELTLEQARLTLAPLRVEVPGGEVKVAAHYEPAEADFATGLDVDVERFDYGVLARRLDPEVEQSGEISLDIDIDTRARDVDDLLARATGRFDFAVWPRTVEADVFDLWAVNLFTAVNSSVDKPDAQSQSKVNCVVGVFDIDDGLMTSRAIFADTTRMQVHGEGKVDFKSGEITVHAKPRPKQAEFFSAATPVEVKGNIEDFRVDLPPGAILETVMRMATSVVTTPIARVLEKPLPADGQEACEQAFRREAQAR